MPEGDSLIGTVLDGKYSVDRLLGRGGMGEVYAGTHVALNRIVAIKVLHTALTENRSFVARFEREARTTAMLEHPNAVHVYDFGTLADGSRFLVMEYIEGSTLRDILRANPTLPPGVAIDLVCQAAGAVSEAHARGIIHRDLKPENLMVRRDDSGRLVLKVVDFGLAKILENTTSLLTNASEIMGTPKYMAPEQFQGTTVDSRADVYALGCVLYELIVGRTPYEGTILEIVGQHVYAEIPLISNGEGGLPPGIEAAIHRALAKDPATRTQSAATLALELQEAAKGIAIDAQSLLLPEFPADVGSESSGYSDVTALPDGSVVKGGATMASAYAAESVGTPNVTVVVDIPTRRRAWPIPAALGIAGIVVISGMTLQGVGTRVEPQAPSMAQPVLGPVPSPAAPAEDLTAPSVPEAESDAPTAPPSRPRVTNSPDSQKLPESKEAKKDNRGVLPTVGAKTKEAVVGTGRQAKRLGDKIRRGIPGLKPKKNDRR